MRTGTEVVYQIFPERFAIGAPHTSASKLALPVYQAEGNGLRLARMTRPIRARFFTAAIWLVLSTDSTICRRSA